MRQYSISHLTAVADLLDVLEEKRMSDLPTGIMSLIGLKHHRNCRGSFDWTLLRWVVLSSHLEFWTRNRRDNRSSKSQRHAPNYHSSGSYFHQITRVVVVLSVFAIVSFQPVIGRVAHL